MAQISTVIIPKYTYVFLFAELGDKHVHENPAVLSLGVLFYRWHNHLARIFTSDNTEKLPAADIFAKSRKWVIASLQVY